jgi:hypothetical protein
LAVGDEVILIPAKNYRYMDVVVSCPHFRISDAAAGNMLLASDRLGGWEL